MEDIGLKVVGTTSNTGIISSASLLEFISVTIAGSAGAHLHAGLALHDSATAGIKEPYYNSESSPTGVCILFEDVTILVSGGNVTTDGLIAGNVKSSKVLDMSGNAVDAEFKALLPKVRFE